MNKTKQRQKSKAVNTLDKTFSAINDIHAVVVDTDWSELTDELAESPYYEQSKVERRGLVRKTIAVTVGGLAVGMAATGRRKWAAGMGIYAASQLASQAVDEKISKRREFSAYDENHDCFTR